MKKRKNGFKLGIIVLLICILTTGCFKRDDMEDINIITTSYPLEYVLRRLYGENSVINSIYPDGVNINEHEITEKEYKDFSTQDLFVYNGLSSDRDKALNLLNRNKSILIMDANMGMEIQYGIEELWLNPSNLLMISQNIKNGLGELINSTYIKKNIDEAYAELKVELSELDAEIKKLSNDAKSKTIVVASKTLQYLSKYGFEVILINDEDTNSNNEKRIKELINSKEIQYIYILENEEESNALQKIKKEENIEIIIVDSIDNINDEERDNKEDYISLMRKNIDLFRKESES